MTKTLLQAVLICSFAIAAFGLQVQKCKSGDIPTMLDIEGCSKTPCTIVNGQNLKLSAEFVAPHATKSLTVKVIPRIGLIAIPFELPEEHRDGCKKLVNAQCPLGRGQRVQAAANIPIQAPVKNVKVNVEFQLRSDSGLAICFKMDVKIV
ncbi:NPC intracellular cholesterol transporter 2-like [Uranotaenia lowii]|uniref:NPC intracellular cholesterol transporter 2-like n=1 Tax=Uranotaenia lowii TaxID=190385 RepID=UPI00247A6DFB|nr:NPC intracellular cholesterol transporter 2-like [Uranotaenia lowii]